MFEQQLENDMAALLSACGVKVYTSVTVPEEPEYPHILVMCDRESDCGFGESVIVRSADLLVLASTYRSDDPDGARLREIVEKISGTLLAGTSRKAFAPRRTFRRRRASRISSSRKAEERAARPRRGKVPGNPSRFLSAKKIS